MLSARLLSIAGPPPALMPGRTVSVLVPVPLDGPFDYRLGADGPVPDPGHVRRGAVRRPTPRRRGMGHAFAKPLPEARLKPLGAVLEAPPMPPTVRALLRHVARETLAPQGAVLKLAMSVPAALEPWPVKLAYRRAAGLRPRA